LFTKVRDLQVPNTLWADSSYVIEECFSGVRVLFTIDRLQNTLQSDLGYTQNVFPTIRDAKLYGPLKETIFTGVLVPPEGSDKGLISLLLRMGALGAERLQNDKGIVRLVLTDILVSGGIDLTEMPFSNRRVYLEDAYIEIMKMGLGNEILLPDVVRNDKRKFFNYISGLGAKGVILKGLNDSYGAEIYKVGSPQAFKNKGNITLEKKWQALEKKNQTCESFNFDNYLAYQALAKPANEKLLTTF
jgi:ATP-dependent DNA ligase